MPLNEDEIKRAFYKVKEEILGLKAELQENKALLENLKKEVQEIRQDDKMHANEVVSIGNQGVPKHILSTPEAHPKHILSTPEVHSKDPDSALASKGKEVTKEEYFSRISSLPYYEFKAFLILYQLDEEFGRANYHEIASKLGVSYGTAGSYVSSLLRKNAPLVKTKLNKNRTVISINPSFKALNPYPHLMEMYYQRFKFDSEAPQSRITEF